MNSDTLYSIAFIVSAAVSLAVAVASWRRRPAPGSTGLALLCFAQFVWSAVFALQWILTDHSASLGWLLARMVGLQVTPTAILVFVLDYLGKRAWLTKRRLALLIIQPVAILLIAATDPWHGLYLNGFAPLVKISNGGPAFWLNLLYSYTLILIAAGLLVVHLVRRAPYPQQATVLLVAVMLPVTHFLAQVMGFDLLPRVNSVPYTFTISSALKWYALTRLGLFRLIPVARDQIIEQLPMGIVVFDSDRHVVDINPAALALTGSTGSWARGKTADLAFPEQVETIALLREGLLEAPTSRARAEFAPGLHVEAVASALLDRSQNRIGTLLTLRDISAEVEADLMQRDFVANVAHELQTPLTGLSLLADTIPRALQSDPAAVEGFVGRLGAEVKRLVHLTQELMALSRAEGRPRLAQIAPTTVAEVVDGAVSAIEHLAHRKSQSVMVCVPQDLSVYVDEIDLETLVGNLLSNAVRYSGDGGSISIHARCVIDDSRGSWVELAISDDGIGIPSEDQERIFERFYRVDKDRSRQTGGAGLGLSIVKQLVEKHGGSVSVESDPGEGSTFTLRLPAS